MILSHVTFNYDLFMEGLKKRREREIAVYKDWKFILLRLIYDY
jgi:hypothetical protein